jgi:hypothetical protein
MAYIRTREIGERVDGKPVVKHQVVWRETVRDDFGVPLTPPHARSHKQTFTS